MCTLNVRGVQSSANRLKKFDILMQTNFDVLCLQELRLSTNADVDGVRNLWSKDTSLISIGEDTADGVGIFFKSHVNIIRKRDIVPGRLLVVFSLVGKLEL